MSKKLTAHDVLSRYMEEDLPEFCGMELKSVNQSGNFGDAPLHVACTRGNKYEVQALIDAGADINAPGELGNTPLHAATGQNHISVVKILLKSGASKSKVNNLNQTPLDKAKMNENKILVALLE
ncbi:ankyrin repeat domain-containing protein [Buttiauxella ferragutiae]|jgi:ankyrin repeat protein|uniref:ankyrin repeat domain-containing protein n=1 Tax=Buttiauxella ferragutiae TaxID=82989 RepID=UPI001E4220A2|nr:ankyrin repeat domain-containing protein [Buttiauxella ferragutiae]MCE0825325.1 ankyrin repeat domain-containing protein [Buttiauxella ferragutiae]